MVKHVEEAGGRRRLTSDGEGVVPLEVEFSSADGVSIWSIGGEYLVVISEK